MKIHSLKVKNFKIHREQCVEFDDRVTLVGGPNETGKSTLLDALTAALFLRAKGSSREHSALRSLTHAGHPEVELVFSTRGETYTVTKCFSGNNGASLLRQQGGPVWKGDEVEEQLAVLLGVEPSRKHDAQWSHLLIRQGRSGEDPADHARSQSENLVRRLQSEGGTAVLLSAKDQKVAAYFSRLHEETFKQDDKPKAGSALAQAIAAEQSARQSLESVRDRHEKLIDAVQEHDEAATLIAGKTAELSALQPELAAKKASLTEAEKLEAELRAQELEAKTAADEHSRLEAAEKNICETRAAEADLRRSLAPLQAELVRAEQALGSATEAITAAEKAYAEAAATEERATLRAELTRADQTTLEKSKAVKDLEKTAVTINKRRKQLEETNIKIAGLPEIGDEALDELQTLSTRVDAAKAKLEATATKVRIVSADAPVKIGSDMLATGDERILTFQTELLVGQGTCVSLTPGGASSVQEASAGVEQAEKHLRDALARYGAASLAGARKTAGDRTSLIVERDNLRDALAAIDAEATENDLQDARTELAQAENTLASLLQEDSGFVRADSIASSRTATAAAEEMARNASTARSAAEAGRNQKRNKEADMRSERDRLRNDLNVLGQQADAKKAQVDLLLLQNGDDASRPAKIATALAEKNRTYQAFQQAKSNLQEMQIEQLRLSIGRLEAAIKVARDLVHDAEKRKAVALATLQRDSEDDPEAALKRAEALHGNTKQALELTRRTADARSLLHRLFQDQKSELAREYTRPLVSKIISYLRCIFGPHVNADVELQGDQMNGVKISRAEFGGVAFDFNQLSGGTAEQVAAAARLAMAEVLAADHGGHLPVVFDDAFTNTDPDRSAKIQDMLYLAAEHGLQVIVLSCNPADYAGSGAKEVRLSKVRSLPGAEPPEAPDAAPLEEGLQVDTALPDQWVTEERKQEFLSALEAAGAKSGNTSLRAALGWNESLYESVKMTLIADGSIESGKGRGGSVKLI